MKRFLNWLSGKKPPQKASTRSNSPAPARNTPNPARPVVPRSQPEYVDFELVDQDGSADSKTDDGEGIDPYNTGRFDRSKNWDKRYRND